MKKNLVSMFFVFFTRGLILTAIWQFATFVFSLSHQSLLLFHYSFHLKTNPPNHVLRLLIRIPSFQCSPTQKSLLASLVVSNNTPASSSFIASSCYYLCIKTAEIPSKPLEPTTTQISPFLSADGTFLTTCSFQQPFFIHHLPF